MSPERAEKSLEWSAQFETNQKAGEYAGGWAEWPSLKGKFKGQIEFERKTRLSNRFIIYLGNQFQVEYNVLKIVSFVWRISRISLPVDRGARSLRLRNVRRVSGWANLNENHSKDSTKCSAVARRRRQGVLNSKIRKLKLNFKIPTSNFFRI